MKILITLFLSFFSLNTFALNESCFEYVGNISATPNEIFLLNSNSRIDYITNETYFKIYKTEKLNLDYNAEISKSDKAFLQDDNNDTFYTLGLTSNSDNFFLIDLNKQVGPGINIDISIDSIDYGYNINISDDGNNWKKVSINYLDTFEFRFIKLSFYNYQNSKLNENIKIRKLKFYKNNFTYLVLGNGSEMNFYGNFFCSNSIDYNSLKNYTNKNLIEGSKFIFNSNLKTFDILLSKNTSYDTVDKGSDIDNDLVIDNVDNCKNDYNPNQLDTNTNGVGDICDDDDGDSIMGKNDNCPYIYNPDQKDINNNKVGDVCEFDRDKDGVFDSLDNCINNYNPDQKDIDNDDIGDICDNCKIYNPTQKDINNNNVGDVCEDAEKYAKENDLDKDGIFDYVDNCKNIFNPNQEDSDFDTVGNVCDNCINIKNKLQEDFDKNGIGDMCEDSDKDSFLGYLDNCINDYNIDQKDSDNNGIGDLCEDTDNDSILNGKDNCEYDYNLDQRDTDKDGIGDICDKNDDRFIESNKYFFVGLMIFVVLLFLGGIYVMFNKLKKSQ